MPKSLIIAAVSKRSSPFWNPAYFKYPKKSSFDAGYPKNKL